MQAGEVGAQRALAFFTQAGLTRLLELLRAKYIAEGEVRGQIVLDEATSEERRELASFLGKPPYQTTTIKVRLVAVDQALRTSGFACSLLDVLRVQRPDEPLETRPELRAAHALYQAAFRQALLTIASAFLESARSRAWLLSGAHGIEWLYARYKNVSADEQQRQLGIIRYVAGLLDRLPAPDSSDRLALFAQRTSGDPHALDSDRAEGRLFLLALSDTFADGLPVQDREHALRLYNSVGLLVDTISSSVAVFNLAGAMMRSGAVDPLVQAAGARVLLLPQRQLLAWSQAQSAQPYIYVMENPQVFEEIVDDLLRRNKNSALPTLICTSGWPSVTALLLLDLLVAASPENRLYYSGDFDLKGLQIATYLLARYKERCHLWHFGLADYAQALQAEGVAARGIDLEQLTTLPSVFADLIVMMQEKKRWAYQEGITQLLLLDMCADSEGPPTSV